MIIQDNTQQNRIADIYISIFIDFVHSEFSLYYPINFAAPIVENDKYILFYGIPISC